MLLNGRVLNPVVLTEEAPPIHLLEKFGVQQTPPNAENVIGKVTAVTLAPENTLPLADEVGPTEIPEFQQKAVPSAYFT